MSGEHIWRFLLRHTRDLLALDIRSAMREFSMSCPWIMSSRDIWRYSLHPVGGHEEYTYGFKWFW